MDAERGAFSDLPDEVELLVIGSGPAGVNAARSCVDSGGPGQVLIITEDVDPPYERPPLTKEMLAGDEPVSDLHRTKCTLFSAGQLLNCSFRDTMQRQQDPRLSCSASDRGLATWSA